MKNKTRPHLAFNPEGKQRRSGFVYSSELLSLGSVYRAGVLAGTAVDALISIDLVLTVTLVDSLGRAVVSASAARNAAVIDNVSHGKNLRFDILAVMDGTYNIIAQTKIFARGV